jgi:hypothetical protein
VVDPHIWIKSNVDRRRATSRFQDQEHFLVDLADLIRRWFENVVAHG